MFPISSAYKRPSTTSLPIPPPVVVFQAGPYSSSYNRRFCSYTRESMGHWKLIFSHILCTFITVSLLWAMQICRKLTISLFFVLSSLAIVVKFLANMLLTVTCLPHFLVQLLLTHSNLQLSWKLLEKFEGNRKTKMHAFNVSSRMYHNV